uniref:Autotransporter adhesin BpaC-like n=1 Tax=Geotrypetes seraphini TaxID=260995 RepID=A0A6P8NI02_GEOSA|nr:autotransporter adhesin BpaC-like [Geotrypetes seraphini]
MEHLFFILLLSTLLTPACCLKCYENENQNVEFQVTCAETEKLCKTTIFQGTLYSYRSQKVHKSCASTEKPDHKTSLSSSKLKLLLEERYCNTDLCNEKAPPITVSAPNDMQCHSCLSYGAPCSTADLSNYQCREEQKQCVDVAFNGNFGEFSNVRMKGCGHLPYCKDNLQFYNSDASFRVNCCNASFCNMKTNTSMDSSPNGVQCYSCTEEGDSKCSSGNVGTVQCSGTLTSCLEAFGTKSIDGVNKTAVIKGCATPDTCDSSVMTLLQQYDSAEIHCCKGNLCNSRVSGGVMTADTIKPSATTIQQNVSTQTTPSGGITYTNGSSANNSSMSSNSSVLGNNSGLSTNLNASSTARPFNTSSSSGAYLSNSSAVTPQAVNSTGNYSGYNSGVFSSGNNVSAVTKQAVSYSGVTSTGNYSGYNSSVFSSGNNVSAVTKQAVSSSGITSTGNYSGYNSSATGSHGSSNYSAVSVANNSGVVYNAGMPSSGNQSTGSSSNNSSAGVSSGATTNGNNSAIGSGTNSSSGYNNSMAHGSHNDSSIPSAVSPSVSTSYSTTVTTKDTNNDDNSGNAANMNRNGLSGTISASLIFAVLVIWLH